MLVVQKPRYYNHTTTTATHPVIAQTRYSLSGLPLPSHRPLAAANRSHNPSHQPNTNGTGQVAEVRITLLLLLLLMMMTMMMMMVIVVVGGLTVKNEKPPCGGEATEVSPPPLVLVLVVLIGGVVVVLVTLLVEGKTSIKGLVAPGKAHDDGDNSTNCRRRSDGGRMTAIINSDEPCSIII